MAPFCMLACLHSLAGYHCWRLVVKATGTCGGTCTGACWRGRRLRRSMARQTRRLSCRRSELQLCTYAQLWSAPALWDPGGGQC